MHINSAAMPGKNLARRPKTHAVAVLSLGGHAEAEEVVEHAGVNAGTLIGNDDLYAVGLAINCNAHTATLTRRCFDRIAD
jgi:hypothetical protein